MTSIMAYADRRPLRTATILALAAAFISGTSNFVNKIGVTAVKDPIVYTTLKNAVVAVFLVALALLIGKRAELAAMSAKNRFRLFAVGIVGGSLPFALYFTGLTMTSAANASIIHKSLFLWVALLAVPLLKERMTRMQWLGIGAIFAANLLIGGFTGFKYNLGELMILAATLHWAVENVIAKKALAEVSSVTVAAARMVVGALVLLPFALTGSGTTAIASLTPEKWGWVLLTSVLLIGYVLTWYAALKRAPATYVATLLVPATLVTNILSAVFVTHAFSGAQAASAALFAAGAAAVVLSARKPEPAAQPA